MASTVTVSQLKTRTRRAADVEAATSRFPDSEIEDYLKTAHREWTDFILNNDASSLLETTHSVSTVANTATVSLAADHYRMLGVTANISGTPVSLRRMPLGERDRYGSWNGSWGAMHNVSYRETNGSTLTLYPTPNAAYALTVFYVPEAEVDFSTGSNTIDGFNGWDEFIVLKAAILCLDKDRRPKDHLERRLRKLEGSVISAIRGLDSGEPDTITDVRGRSYPYFPRF